MPVNICEQKHNVGTWKMHVTLSRLTTGSEDIIRYNMWLRPAREKQKKFWISPLKLLKFCMNRRLLHSCARLQNPKLWIQSQKNCYLLHSQSSYKPKPAQGWKCLLCWKVVPSILHSSIL